MRFSTSGLPLWKQLSLAIGLAGCTVVGGSEWNERFGESQAYSRAVETLPPGAIDYWSQVKPVLEGRCAVCHGCYDAPCQLKLGAIEGIERGATPQRVYDATRLTAADPTRLFVDAHSPEQWRERGFHPVLNERANVPEANRQLSLLYRVLEQKERAPFGPEHLDDFDFSLDRPEVCPTAEVYDDFAQAHPRHGMPWALPALPARERDVVMQWVEQGAPWTPRPALPETARETVARWERFLNGDSLKRQLMSRYLYEHLFLAHLYFEEPSGGEAPRFFEMVRSTTPSGQPIEVVATRRPFDDPGTARPFYRLRELRGALLDKTHMPYLVDEARMERWTELFLEADYEVSELPSYEPEVASNPFLAFQELPARSRYRFMLEESEYTIMGFIKGPVCRGQVALNVIEDHFWVFFVDPELPFHRSLEEALIEQAPNVELPAQRGSTVVRILEFWREIEEHERDFLKAKARFVDENLAQQHAFDEQLLWDGDGKNANAALTVFRHFDNATVEKGLLGGKPKTAWVISYPLLERIHYLLVAGYDVYGNVGHQLLSRVTMDFLRMEGETNFLYFLPTEARQREREYWYRGASEEVMAFLEMPRAEYEREPAIQYHTDDPKTELFDRLAKHLAPALAPTQSRTVAGARPDVHLAWLQLQTSRGRNLSHLPENLFVTVRREDGRAVHASLLLNRARANVTSIFDEEDSLLPDEDTLSVVPGLLGSYPNALFEIDESDLGEFVERIGALSGPEAYAALEQRYGVPRWSARFWKHSDRLHADYRRSDPVRGALLDFNRLGAR